MMREGHFPVRWIPKRNPHPAISFLITAGSLLLVILAMWALRIGRGGGVLGTSTLFPALILITVYAGWRWSLGALVLVMALVLWGLTRVPTTVPLQLWFSQALVFASGVICILVAGAARALVIDLDEERSVRARAEEGARESEMRFGAMADSAPTLMWVSRADGSRSFVNAAYMEFMGLPNEAALKLDWRDRLHPDDSARIHQEEKALGASPDPVTLEARYRRGDGEWRWIRSISRPRLTSAGEIDGYIGIAFDITDAKRAEGDLKSINQLLAERIAAAMAERDQAQAALMQAQKLEAVGQLTGGVAHDFNNLLTVIIGALDIIQRHPEDERRRTRMAEAALSAARRGEQLNQQLLAFARREALHPTIFSLDDQLRTAETLMRRAAGESIELTFDLKAPKAHVRADTGQLEAAILNLLINARDAVADNGRVTLSSRPLRLTKPRGEIPPGDYVEICVADDGMGMDRETLAHIFEPFFTTKPVGKGTGLGLAQVYGFAKQSQGFAEVESAPDKGTTIHIVLPVSRDKPPEVLASPTLEMTKRAQLKVLLVEDDADVAELVEAMLKELGHKVVRAPDARVALKLTVTEPELGLMLTDVIMPGGKNGVELAREVSEIRPDLPVILSSGYTGESLQGAEAAPWPLLRKPYTLEALSGVIDNTVRAHTH